MSRPLLPGSWATPEAVAEVLRPRFLATVGALVPGVLQSLRENVLPVYQRRHQRREESNSFASRRVVLSRPAPANAETGSVNELTWRENDPNPNPDLFTDEEAAALFDCGYELFGDRVPPGQERFFVWRAQEGHPSCAGTPSHTYEDFDTLHAYETDLTQALLDWAIPFNLTDTWVLGSARRQLAAWDQYWFLAYPHCKWPRAAESWSTHERGADTPRSEDVQGPVCLRWLPVSEVTWFSPTTSRERRLLFMHPGWETTLERRAMAKARILADFGQFLENYLGEMEALTRRNRDDCIRPPAYVMLSQFMDWVVRYQCLREDYTQIAASPYGHAVKGSNYQAVAMPALQLMKQMGLTPRKAHKGRPKGVQERWGRYRVR